MPLWTAIGQQITGATARPFTVKRREAIGGGCINTAYVVGDGTHRYFVKLNDAAALEMFEAEAQGLQEIEATATVRVPQPIVWGVAEGQAFLVLENLELGRRGAMERFGQQLAQMHRVTWERYGWRRDNTIGATPQINTPTSDWVEFWREYRLGYQLRLAAQNGYRGSLQRKGGELLERFPALFRGYAPLPSLLHGDLWSGNYAVDQEGRPVIFDPAVYYGDREADIAMTELFAGFAPPFYAAYNEAWPLDEGYRVRKILYALYHILNHLNLFGGGYGFQAERMIGQLLSELR